MATKYNHYAVELNDAFCAARSTWRSAKAAVTAAENQLRDCKPQYRGFSQADLEEAKANFRRVDREVWDNFARKRSKLRDALAEEIRKDNCADPGDVDMAALELLKSGTLTPDDYENFIERYDSNPTMLRLTGRYAEEAAKGAEGEYRKRLNVVRAECQSGNSAALRAFDDLCGASRYASGEVHPRNRSERMLNRWEAATGDAIDNF